jgi:hypothetical protein
MSADSDPRLATRAITRITAEGRQPFQDPVAVERALEIRVDGRALAVTLCTPGHDEELARHRRIHKSLTTIPIHGWDRGTAKPFGYVCFRSLSGADMERRGVTTAVCVPLIL